MADSDHEATKNSGEGAAEASRPKVEARLRRNSIAVVIPKVKPLVKAMRSLGVAK